MNATTGKAVAQLCRDYIDLGAARWRPSTLVQYNAFARTLTAALGDKEIATVDRRQLHALREQWITEGYSAHRINLLMSFLHSCFEEALADGLIPTNPATLRRLKRKPTEVDPLTPDELALALDRLSPEWCPAFELLAYTGMRPMEACALRWADVDIEGSLLRISRGRVRGQEGPLKTESSYRTIRLFDQAKAALKKLKILAGQSDYVLSSRTGHPLNGHLDRIWALALTRAGVRHRPAYQLRHTFASICLSAGIEPGWVSTQLGHSSLQTTYTHYFRYIKGEGQREQEKLTARLLGRGVDTAVNS